MMSILKNAAILATLVCAFADKSTRFLPGAATVPPTWLTYAPTEAPTVAPTAAPTLIGSMVATMPPTMSLDIPEDERCVQTVIPPGVKPGSCMEIMCYPPNINEGQEFNVVIRFCLQRPRMWHATFGLLDERTKEYFGGAGTGVTAVRSQCAEVTLRTTFDATPIDGVYDVMWKTYVTNNHGTAEYYVEDRFPNMLAEAGIPAQPDYTTPLDPEDDCVDTGDMRLWNLPPTGMQDGIEWSEIPDCFQPGEEWSFQIDTHLESMDTADLHCNLQIGTGGDLYLGDEDVYVTESNVYGLIANPKTDDWDNLPEDYWTYSQIVFTAEQTALVEDGSRVYLACFLVPAFAQYDATLPLGWDFLDREFYLMMEYC